MLLLSIHPEYVERILNGTKTVELRKRRPNVELGSQVLIYSTMPEGKIVAQATISKIEVRTPGQLWKTVKKKCGVVKSAFDAYYEFAEKAVGIHLVDVMELEVPLSLDAVRAMWPEFHPPQQFRYLEQSHVDLMFGTECLS